jgi:GTP cyclohydrolase IA
MPIDDRVKVTNQIKFAIQGLFNLEGVKDSIGHEHVYNTPERVAKSMMEMFSGCWEDPRSVLKTTFKNNNYDQILYVNDISIISVCAHHGLYFLGKAHFGYLPDAYYVGLSKIPRLVHVYAKRPQVQEQLTAQIVDTFMEVLKPKGCGLVIEAYHLCMMARGVEEQQAYTKTTALRGSFKEGSTKQEFLQGIHKTTEQIWP